MILQSHHVVFCYCASDVTVSRGGSSFFSHPFPSAQHKKLSPADPLFALRRSSIVVDLPDRTQTIPKQLARAGSGSQQANPEELAAPTELSLPQLCLAVSAKELIAGISGKGRGGRADGAGKVDGGGGDGGDGGGAGAAGASGAEEGKGSGGLFRERQSLAFFAVDCRPKDQVNNKLGEKTVSLGTVGGVVLLFLRIRVS